MNDLRDSISAANDRFMQAFQAQDAAGIAALYTNDATLLPPGSTMITGKEAIHAFWQSVMDMGIREAKLSITDVQSSGPLAYEVSRFELSGSDVALSGKYVVVWKNDGGWKLHVDIWNTDE
ncbi:MAG: SgcJ/EcaC family oxidoreductase [Pyrinomonadaceae bacterium]